jgi:hypothetical protein
MEEMIALLKKFCDQQVHYTNIYDFVVGVGFTYLEFHVKEKHVEVYAYDSHWELPIAEFSNEKQLSDFLNALNNSDKECRGEKGTE